MALSVMHELIAPHNDDAHVKSVGFSLFAIKYFHIFHCFPQSNGEFTLLINIKRKKEIKNRTHLAINYMKFYHQSFRGVRTRF